ncbi:unnamed protein product, partial [marine sediment metagenome]
PAEALPSTFMPISIDIIYMLGEVVKPQKGGDAMAKSRKGK